MTDFLPLEVCAYMEIYAVVWWTDYVFISVRFMCYFFLYCFSKIQNKKAKVNSREYLLLKEDVFMRVGVALFFPLGKKLPQIVL